MKPILVANCYACHGEGGKEGGISFDVARSTHVALVGPPGAGASALLRIIAGELKAGAGEVRIGPHDVTKLPKSRRPLLYATTRQFLAAFGLTSVRDLPSATELGLKAG